MNLIGFLFNRKYQKQILGNGQLVATRNTVCDIHKTGKLMLQHDLVLNAYQKKRSRKQSFLMMHENATLTVNGRFDVYSGTTVQVFKNGKLTLGKGYINCDSVIACANEITIGDGATIARGVYIYDGDHHRIYNDQDKRLNTDKPIHIGDHVWIGVNAVILKGVTIGEYSVIAAGSVVTRDIPDHVVAGGVPAKVIKPIKRWD